MTSSNDWRVTIGSNDKFILVQPLNKVFVTDEDIEKIDIFLNKIQFKDICKICGHEIDNFLVIGNAEQMVCVHTDDHPGAYMNAAHSPCTYGGCMPDLEFRRDNMQQGQALWPNS